MMESYEIKLDLSQVRKDIIKGIYESSCRGLFQTQKWLSELNYALQKYLIAGEVPSLPEEPATEEYAAYLLARSYFNMKEYDRAAYFVKDFSMPKARFLHFYSRYCSIEKKKLDSMTDANCPPDPAQNDALKDLCSELKNDFYDNKLDGYCMYLYGITLKKLDLKQLAITVLIKAVQEEPILWCAWYELGKLTNDKSNNCASQLPDHWMKDFFLAHAYLEQLNNDESLQLYQSLYNAGFCDSTYVMAQIALGYHNRRKLDNAIDLFQKITEADPYRLDNLDTYSNLLYVLERKTELGHLAHKVVKIDKYRVETCCVIGNYYSLRSDHAKAVLYFKRALKLNPQFLSAWTLMGHEYMEMKNINAAIQSYRYAIEINPRDYRAWYGLGQTYEILKMPFYCLYYYKQAQQLKPNDSRMVVALGETYERLDRTENALKCYYKAYMIGDIEGSALIKLAKLYDKLNENENAAAVFIEYCLREEEKDEKIPEEQNDYYNALQYLANYYLKRGELDDAYTYAYKCMECDETKEEGKALLKAIAAKRVEIETAADIDPEHEDMNVTTGVDNLSALNQENAAKVSSNSMDINVSTGAANLLELEDSSPPNNSSMDMSME